MNDSSVVSQGSCPDCGSSDACTTYDDGHTYCFSCESHKQGDGGTVAVATPKVGGLLEVGEATALPTRGITLETCDKWGYTKSLYNGADCYLATYRDLNGRPIAQKVRLQGKEFKFLGDAKNCGLYGMHLWKDGGRMVVVTEGEIDALSVSQLQGNKWPVVSLPKGAAAAKKDIKANLLWLLGFETVVLMFDNDEPGRTAAESCAQLFPIGQAKIARLPLKDASEMLVANRGKECIDAIWQAKEYRPDGIITLDELEEELMKPVEVGSPWPWESLTKLTYGRRPCEVYCLGAGTGVGKTDVFTQIIAQTVTQLKEKCGVIYLEQPPAETVRRIAGKVAKRRFHIPDAQWSRDEFIKIYHSLRDTKLLYMYDHFGSTEWDIIKLRIRYMVTSLGCKHIFLDHLTALAAHAVDERRTLEGLMADVAGMAQELKFCFYVISHLATPDGVPHEEGGRVMVRHFKGSRSIGQWSHFMFGLERDQQADNHTTRHTTTFRILKDRVSGQATGQKMYLMYDADSGDLIETTDPSIGDFNDGKNSGKSNRPFDKSGQPTPTEW